MKPRPNIAKPAPPRNAKSSQDVAPRQLELPIEFAPAEVKRHGYRDAHSRPLVGRRFPNGGFKVWRTSPARAWDWPYIELNAANAYTVLILDCDDPEVSIAAFVTGLLPWPNWFVVNRKSGHFHAAYALAVPVHRYPEAAVKPLQYFARIAAYLQTVAGADSGYIGVLTRNPAEWADPDTRTIWAPGGRVEAWTLDELAAYIPKGWKATTARLADTWIGRNVALFIGLIRWAGREANRGLPVIEQAERLNTDFDTPLPFSEIQATAKQVEKYRVGWEANGWHCPQWIARQRSRGRRGGYKSGVSRRMTTAERDAEIVEARRGGMTVAAIVAATGIAERTVYYVLRRDGDKRVQGALNV